MPYHAAWAFHFMNLDSYGGSAEDKSSNVPKWLLQKAIEIQTARRAVLSKVCRLPIVRLSIDIGVGIYELTLDLNLAQIHSSKALAASRRFAPLAHHQVGSKDAWCTVV